MPRLENLLTAKQVQAALRNGAQVQLNDGGGLYFAVTEKNRGTWFMRGRLNGVQKKRVLGHEDMTLAEARVLRTEERKALTGQSHETMPPEQPQSPLSRNHHPILPPFYGRACWLFVLAA